MLDPLGVVSAAACHRALSAVIGPGRTYSGFQCDQTINCQPRKNSARAASFGQSPSQTRENRLFAVSMGMSRASSPAISASCSLRGASSMSSAMAAHLLAEPVRDRAGKGGHLGVVEAPGTGDVDAELVD